MHCRNRELYFESLENRVLLSATSIDAADGLLVYSDDDLLLNSNSSTSEIEQFWPEENLEATWKTLATGDFTGDGISDLYGQFRNERAGLLVNDGQQLFFKYWGQTVPDETKILGQGDFNNDGLLDILSYGDSRNELWVSLNSLELGFSNHLWGALSNANWEQIFVDDFDRDGFTDVLGGERNGSWWLAKSDGAQFQLYLWGSYPDYNWQNVVAGDFNGDQFIDMAARAPDNTWWVWGGSETGLKPARYSGHWKMGSTWHNVQVADFNGDGKDDLIGRLDDGSLWVASSSDAGFQTWMWATGWIDGANWQTMEIVDIDGNGLPEQIGEAADGTWWYAENLAVKFRNHYLGRGFRFIGTVNEFRSDRPTDLSAVFDVGGSSSAAGDNMAEKNRASYARYILMSESPVDAAHDEPIAFSINEAGKLLIHQSKAAVLAIKINSPSRSIVTGASPEPFDDFLVNDAGAVLLVRHGPEPVVFEQETMLDLGWASFGDQPSLEYYNARDNQWHPATSNGNSKSVERVSRDPIPMTEIPAVTTPLIISRNEDNQITVTGSGQVVVGGFSFNSPSRALIPGSSPAPMDFFLDNSPATVTIALLPGASLLVDGTLTLDLSWDEEIDLGELSVEYGLAELNETFMASVKS